MVFSGLSLLSGPASHDSAALEALNLTQTNAIGNIEVFHYLFKKYGYDEAKMGMNLLNFSNVTVARPGFAAYYGTSVQLAGLFSILGRSLSALLGEVDGAVSRKRLLLTQQQPVSQALQQHLLAHIYDQLPVNQEMSYLYTNNTGVIASIMNTTYSSAAVNRSHVPAVPAQKLQEFYDGVAYVSI